MIATLASTVALSGAVFAEDLLLRLDGIKGESTRQKDEIDITSFSWGFSQATSGGKSSVERFVVKKNVDVSSPLLVQNLLSGRTIANATFVVRRDSSDRAATTFIQIDLKDVKVVELSLNGTDSGRPTESVAFTFSKLTYQYFPVDKSGKPGPAITTTWDLGSGKH